MNKNLFSLLGGVAVFGLLLSCGTANLEKATAENSALLDKCIVIAKDAQVKVDAAANAEDVANALNKATDDIKAVMAEGGEVSKKYMLTQDQEEKIYVALTAKVDEFSSAGRDLGEKVGNAMVKFQDDADGLELISQAVENFKTIGE